MDTGRLHTEEGWLEESLWATESLVSDGDDLTVGQFIALLEARAGSSGLHLLLKVKSNVAELLLDVTDNLTLGGGGEGVATLGEDLHEVVSQITTGQVQTEDGVGESVTLVDGDGVGDTITGIKNDTSGTTRGVQGQDGLDGNVHSWSVKGLKHDLGHLLTVGLRVEWSLSKENWVLLRCNTELIVEGVMPDLMVVVQGMKKEYSLARNSNVARTYRAMQRTRRNRKLNNMRHSLLTHLLHIIPVGDYAVLDGVLESEDTSLALGLVSHVGVLLSHAHHDSLMTGTSNDGGEDSSRSIVSCETGLAHTGSVINNQSCNVVFHCFV